MPTAPELDRGTLARLTDITEHYPRKVVEQINGANAAEGNSFPGPLRILMIDIPDAATGDVDTVVVGKWRVVDVWAIKYGANAGAANTVQVKNGSNAITNALDMNVNDNTRVGMTTRDDAQQDLADGATLKVTRTKAGGNAACKVFVALVPVA